MNEQEYIDTSDLAKISSAMAVIRDIVPENSSIITVEDYKMVFSKLRQWQSELFETISMEQP